jgi:HPt (histidine-containing phosphotransfer) domain-containing protein
MTSPIDERRLAELGGGDPVLLAELVTLFLREMESHLAALASDLDAADCERAARTAHQAAGASGLCGAQRLGALLHSVERTAVAGDAGATADTYREVVSEFQAVQHFLAKVIAP